MDRPAVSVIVPFAGDREEGAATLRALGALALRDGDEILVADNTSAPTLAAVPAPPAVRVLTTQVRRDAYGARNEAAAAATADWILFTDADCRWPADVLDAYFAPAPSEHAGAVAGEVAGTQSQRSLASRYAQARGLLRQEAYLRHPFKPMAVTANLLVRRSAFEAIGGFAAGVPSGADADFCWRLQDAGWVLEHRPGAVVEHLHRESVPDLVRQVVRDARGQAWLDARHPGSGVRSPLARSLARSAGGAAAFAARGERERAAFKLIDGVVAAAEHVGYRTSWRGRSTDRPAA